MGKYQQNDVPCKPATLSTTGGQMPRHSSFHFSPAHREISDMLDVQTKPTFLSIPRHAMRFKDAYLTEREIDEEDDMTSALFEDTDELRRPLTNILNGLESFPDGQ